MVFFQNAHLIPDFPLILAHDSDTLGHDSYRYEKTSRHAVESGEINAHRAIYRAPAAVRAFAEGNVLQVIEVLIRINALCMHPPREHPASPVKMALENPSDPVSLVSGSVRWIAGIGKYVVTRTRTIATVNAGYQ
jgi:hypothetical protein